ncbi:MAG: hypothetical protein V8S32_11230 [Lachnospiraceae bacterium]
MAVNGLMEIGVPTYCCPGNHDNLEMFYRGYKPYHYKINEKFENVDGIL